MNDTPTVGAASTTYEAFLADLGHEPSAGECEQWAAQHAGDRDEPRALVDAGWCTARDSRSDEALALFGRAAEFGGEFGRDAQVGIIEQLYALQRDQEADEAIDALRAELDGRPGGLSDLRVYDDMAETLSDAGRHEAALTWCQAGLERITATDDTEDAAEVERYRNGLLISRAFLRRELNLDEDDDDRAVLAESDAALVEFGDLLRALDYPAGGLDLPDGAEPFDGLVLRWERDDFAAIGARWPESATYYGDSYETYVARIQREARAYDEAGATHVLMVTGALPDYEAYAQRVGRDPAEPATRRDFGDWYARTHPDRVQLWPPGRNEPCWCGSGRKYKTCCGAPARN